MAGTVWTKFYWSDWLSDLGLRRCSVEARGLWIDMLCIAAGHDPIGYVAVNGEGLSEDEIAKIACLSPTVCSTLIGELERNGVFSRDRNGKIYSRRMVRDEKKASKARRNGKKGGNPSLRKITGIPPPDNQGLSAAISPICHMPIARESSSVPELYNGTPVRTGGQIDYDDLEEKLRKAANLETDPSAGLLNLSPIVGLLNAGFDLERDILPSIVRQARSSKKRKGSWSYFVPGIRDDKETSAKVDQNSAPLPSLEFSQERLEDHWKWMLDFEKRTGKWPSHNIMKTDIPREFREQWEQGQSQWSP